MEGKDKSALGKKIVLVIIDSIRPEALKKCLQDGTIPAIEYLCHKGKVVFDCVSVFPTMTPTATASIATGLYPQDHGIPGFVWYHREEKRIINYGATPGAIWKIGLKTVLTDLLCNLNGVHLSKKIKTVHEIMADSGLTSANINFFTFRGSHLFKVTLPWWARLWVGFKQCTEIWGPSISIVGQIVPPRFSLKGLFRAPTGLLHKFGVNDEYAGTAAYHLLKSGQQPHLAVVYLPDTDGYTHRHHTKDVSPSVIRADQQIQKILNAFDSWKDALEDNIFILLGDHSQSLVYNLPDSIIKLTKTLGNYRFLKLGQIDDGFNDLAVCPNERMAHVYLLNNNAALKEQIINILSADSRIDQVMWKEGLDPDVRYFVRKGGTGANLTFNRGGPLKDIYGCTWNADGDLSVIDTAISENLIIYGQYPDALNVMASLMGASNCGDIVVTAKIGYEFGGEAAPIHPGKGSHGSFHREDACVPLIMAGTEKMLDNPRVVDIVPFILRNFGIDYDLGEK